MSTDPKAAPAKTAAEVCKHIPLSPPAAKLLSEGMQAKAFLEVLVQKQHFADAVRVQAHLMVKREVIWWACLCSKPDKDAKLLAAYQTAEAWVTSPSDDKRRAAHAAAQTAGVGSPVGLTCEAVFFSEGSMGPAEHQAVPAPEHLTATTAANAIILAAVADAAKMAAQFKQFLALGQDVAAGKNRWK